ncbi:Sucrase/ferredoxin-like-domain-containing protein [Emericellopsis atlantica]|uniref:Altered inheritance of mitochondria protein 32 n=1 Tax=Emericellopsis atlantica TaxID=2614577 RepID=A0A9P7ZIW6_9HYPO|nr:Sucrase/ferredoxin-like-domain-containing protein [Emericellopsis atlantica]KAG9252333.1 Sucrase/ferredoxin-like-domain-containing protein [Emericellopsis atlantica]
MLVRLRCLAHRVNTPIQSPRYFATKTASRIPSKPPPFPTISTCPSPTCQCAPTPDLDIDHDANLNGVITGYAEQILVCTGKDDWQSKIEDEDGLAARLKGVFGRGGAFSDPFWNVSTLNASFHSTSANEDSVYLLPSFKYIPKLSRTDDGDIKAMAKGFVLPRKLNVMHDGLPAQQREALLRDDSYQSKLEGVSDVKDILVLICGHGGRDERCGILGPILRTEFEDKLRSGGYVVHKEAVSAAEDASGTATGARVGLTSHIGGHKFAGNVIIYIPPTLKGHPLAGCGIWYGRVEPKHVEGIVNETVVKGTVVKDKFRGGIDSDRRILRL